jgi:phosphate starvation-inducible PhoH-like protein
MSRKKSASKKPNYGYGARTQNQQKYLEEIDQNKITFGLGPAGTGKTYLAVCKALDYYFLKNGNGGVKRIIVTRPAVECAGEKLGSLPGDVEEKIGPYMWPIYDNFCQLLNKDLVEELIKKDVIHVMPLAFMRGVTFRNAFVIVDEAQNTKPSQMQCVLTRMDDKSRIVICGDLDQSDIRKRKNGMADALERLSNLKEVGVVEFTEDDIMRAGLVKDIILAYRDKQPE